MPTAAAYSAPPLAPRSAVGERVGGPAQLATLGETVHALQAEIATMWRFTRNNGVTEGFHTKMELINKQAFGFCNFKNYRMRVKVLCA